MLSTKGSFLAIGNRGSGPRHDVRIGGFLHSSISNFVWEKERKNASSLYWSIKHFNMGRQRSQGGKLLITEYCLYRSCL